MNSEDDTLAGGLPHSEIPGSPIARISPGLFAACHVLHRLSVPRHPPDALASRLITGGLSREAAASPPAHRAKTPFPHQRGRSPRAGGGPCRMAASHEDTSSDRHKPCGPGPIRLGYITTLSLHPSINIALRVSPQRRSLPLLRASHAPLSALLRAPALPALCRTGEALLRRKAQATPVARPTWVRPWWR